MSGYWVWFPPAFSAVLVAVAVIWPLARRAGSRNAVQRMLKPSAGRWHILWYVAGTLAFLLPVFIYWYSARSHGNALAGFLPWNDAAGYFYCSQSILHGFEISESCGRRPFYLVFFAALLWVAGSQLQLALLLQALVLGAAAVLFARAFSREQDGPCQIGAYAVLFLFAANLCSSLVMTENAGLLLGLLGLAILWRSAEAPRRLPLLLSFALMAAAQNSRSGAMLVLPALVAWALFHAGGSWKQRVGLGLAGAASIVAGILIASMPSLMLTGSFGAAQANFSYSLYGLVAGGKGWFHVFEARPDLFAAGGSERAVAGRIYQASLELVLNQPGLALLGYVKGLVHYFSDLFRFVDPFKLVRFGMLIPLWLGGVAFAIRNRRDRRFALLLWLLAGIFFSSPFITFDGGNRVYAATIGVDAAFVGLGVAWLSRRLAGMSDTLSRSSNHDRAVTAVSGIAAVSVLVVPILWLAAMRSSGAPAIYSQPACAGDSEAIVVRPSRSTLVLPLVEPGEESVFPLRVRADHFTERMDKAVEGSAELRRESGTALVWGYRLDTGHPGEAIRFAWAGRELRGDIITGFCVQPPHHRGGEVGTAVSIHPSPTVK